MYKGKEGKVFASLTEVKNKTGDIFALVDEYGEVTLTSYNKPRYKIVKIDLLDVLDIGDENSSQSHRQVPHVSNRPTGVLEKVKSTVSSITTRRVSNDTPETNGSLLKQSVLDSLSSIKIWDRNNSSEKKFVSNSLKPLQ